MVEVNSVTWKGKRYKKASEWLGEVNPQTGVVQKITTFLVDDNRQLVLSQTEKVA